MQYATEDELLVYHRCAESKRVPAAQYPLCFVYDESRGDTGPQAPRAQGSHRAHAKSMPKKASLKR